MSQSVASAVEPSVLSDEIRDGLLQDLLAVGLILRDLEHHTSAEAASRVATASRAIDADVLAVRQIIDRLKAA